MDETIDFEREKFEEMAFVQYFLSTIVRNDEVPQPRIAGCLDFVSTCSINKSEFCERNGESYKRPDVSAMWFGWKMRVNHEVVQNQRLKKGGQDVPA